jgi:hypothetical protein
VEGTAILDSLAKAHWHVARRTYGNSHATYIGMLVDWWVSQDVVRHSALDGSPQFGRSEGKAAPDALLCSDGIAVGVIEVEGNCQEDKAGKFAAYFADQTVPNLQFGLLLLYESNLRREESRGRAASLAALNEVASVSAKHPSKDIVVVELSKYRMERPAWESSKGYYDGAVGDVKACLYRNGGAQGKRTYDLHGVGSPSGD